MATSNATLKEQHAPWRVLIVDDSFLMRRVIRNIVEEDQSFDIVGEAEDGMQALESVAEQEPDLILLDIEMPRMDGIEFLKQAGLMTTARVVIISSVARLGSPQAEEALQLGAADIIPKPSGALSMELDSAQSAGLLQAMHRCLEA